MYSSIKNFVAHSTNFNTVFLSLENCFPQPQPAKRLHKGIIDTNDVMCPTCKRHFKKQGIKQQITKMHKRHQKTVNSKSAQSNQP